MNTPLHFSSCRWRAFFIAGLVFCGGANIVSAADAAVPDAGSALIARCEKILHYGKESDYYGAAKVDAVIALGLLRDEAAIPLLIDHLENEPSNHVRLQIVRALGWIGSAKSVPALEHALQDKYPHVRKCAALALKEITGKDYAYDKTGLPDAQKMRELLRPPAEQEK